MYKEGSFSFLFRESHKRRKTFAFSYFQWSQVLSHSFGSCKELMCQMF